MEQLYEELQDRLAYLEEQEQTPIIKAKTEECLLTLIRVQFFLLDDLEK